MNRLMTVLMMTLVALASLRPAAAQVKYNVTTLPLLTGAKAARPTAINNIGQVAGLTPSSTTSKTYKGWVWSPATATSAANIQALAPLPGLPRSEALDINDEGYVVGNSSDGSTVVKATLWLPGQYASPVDLNAPSVKGAFLSNWVLKTAIAVSNLITGSTDTLNGGCYVVCVGDKIDPVTGVKTTNFSQGVVCTIKGGIMVSAAELTIPAGADATDPWPDPKDVNNKGQVSGIYSGGYYNSANVTNTKWCCIWDATSGSVLQAVAGLENEAINDAGTVTGQNFDSQGYILAYGAADAQMLPAGFNSAGDSYQSISFGINNKNEVVGQSPEGGTYPAYLWVPTSGGQFNFYRLNDCVPYLRGRHLRKATGINESSSIICEGTLSNVGRAFLLTK